MFSSGIWHCENQVGALSPTSVETPFVLLFLCCWGEGRVKEDFSENLSARSTVIANKDCKCLEDKTLFLFADHQ